MSHVTAGKKTETPASKKDFWNTSVLDGIDRVIHEYLEYDEESPTSLTWKKNVGFKIKAGSHAFTAIGRNGYRTGGIAGRQFYAHRIAWLLNYGKWPSNQIDHINGNINNDGLYCLNDLHKAAVKAGIADENNHRPSKFKDSQIEFIEACSEASEKLISVKGGKSGTYASELITMKYAGWINPAYEVEIYKAVQALKHGDIEKAVELSGSKKARESLDEIRKAKAIDLQLNNASRIFELLPHLGETSKQTVTARLVNPAAGFDVIPLPRIEEKFYSTTELAAIIETTPAMLGRVANQHGMKKQDEFGEFRLSTALKSEKQVEQWHWNQAGADAMRDIFLRLRG